MGSNHLSKGWRVACAVSLGLSVGALSPSAAAFKPGTHVAAANEVEDQLSQVITAGSTPDTLVFKVNGKTLNLKVSFKAAYAAVQKHPAFFRAGTIGPDAFPDPLTGQLLMHAYSDTYAKLIKDISGTAPPKHAFTVPFEDRHGATELRAIDFAMGMLAYLNNGFVGTAEEKEQVLAFIIGYISHGVGDSFAHTWVNELADGAWDLGAGKGMWGPFSEEVKHVAVETLVDSKVPNDLISLPGDGGSRARVVIRSPERFLDEYYASQIAGARISIGRRDGDLFDFFKFYGNIDQFHGGIFYNYFNAQVDIAPTIKNWTGLNGIFDTAEDIKNNGIVNFVLDTAELPAEILQELEQFGPEAWLDDLTGGYINCHTENGGLNDVEKIRLALDFLGGINDRVKVISHKAEVVRHNWIRLSECTSQNLAKTNAGKFDIDNPTRNTDACADIVRGGWQDEGNPNGLFRGRIRPGTKLDTEFLVEMKAAFLGGSADELYLNVSNPAAGNAPFDERATAEAKNDHRRLGGNLSRMKDYLAGIGFSVTELPEGIMPQQDDETSRDKYNQFCGTVRDPGFERCLDIKFAGVAVIGREVKCLAEHAACTADNVKTCLSSACLATCPGSNEQCGKICGRGNPSGCESGCDDIFCTSVFGVDICAPILHDICTGACEIFSSEKDNCLDAALDEAKCGVEHIVCGVDNLKRTIELDNYASELLSPARDACDTIDRALEFVECLRGDPTKTPEEQRTARRGCLIDACTVSGASTRAECVALMDQVDEALDEVERVKNAIAKVADVIENRPAHEFVNLAFLKEDMIADPTYLSGLKTSVAATRADLLAHPPGSGASPEDVAIYNRKLATLDRFDALTKNVEDIRAGRSDTGNPLVDLRDASEEAANVLGDAAELGLIPTVIGPTAQKILANIGPSFKQTFLPFFNTVQGMKVAPMMSKTDLTGLFAQEGVSTALLPGETQAVAKRAYSAICTGVGSNPYCDVLKSFDDPNCLNCSGAIVAPNPSLFDWVEGRGLVAFNKYDPSKAVQHVVTNLPFADTNQAYDSLYTRIFQVPEAVPVFAGFDDPTRPWKTTNGNVTIDPNQRTQGGGSLALNNGCGYSRLDSPTFLTTEFGVVGDQLWFDIFIPANQTNPFWVGDAQVSISIPGANINNQYLPSWLGMTALPRGAWSTLKYTVPAEVRTALLGDFANGVLSIHLNLGSCTSPVLLDNLRFAGNLKQRERFHIRGSQLNAITTSPLLSFDNRSDWSATVALGSSTNRVQGTASLSLAASGYTVVKSRPFNTTEIPTATNRLSVDLFIPNPQPNQYWYGDVQLALTCGSLTDSYVGRQPLTNLFSGEFNTLDFHLSDQQVAVLRAANSGCRWSIAVNVNPSGSFLLDNMGFY